jgi:integrase/recombinase XerD
MTYLPALYRQKDYPHVTEAEAKAIWLEAKTREIRLFIKILWFTGLRLAEVLNLKAGNLIAEGIDYSLRITRVKKRNPEPEVLPIPRDLGLDIREYIQDADLRPSAKLFSKHENAYRYQVKQCAKRAGIERWQEIHPHCFRHGFIYHKAHQGLHPYLVSRLAGHGSLQVTLGYYHPSQDDLRKAMNL